MNGTPLPRCSRTARTRSQVLGGVGQPDLGAPISTAVAGEDTVRDLVARAAPAGVDVEVRREARAGDRADEVVRIAGAVERR